MSDKAQTNRIYHEVVQDIKRQGLTIVDKDRQRPWGGFFVIEEQQAPAFADIYFDNLSVDDLKISGKLSPKILIVEPRKRLSWQYHHRRAEIWKVVRGPAGVIRSDTDEQGPLERFETGETITLKQGERHRLVGLDNWSVLAEIWQHTDPDNPSDEDDIVRLEDDFGR
ncbi:phosphoheptose isomerase [Fodinibius sediminis]|uniref:Mannose-6-phosphate isomerase, type 2 n=1 Tax=Fodinibius sediminis TaxID=1214077 RepID=A0A521F6G2_9BACT|nr:phosphoheptose isomerase [Fodinibius sediminis]SMO91100.1 mannose-6-phosphate isomerase, type 2 [Fodinibius sediminis]